MLASSGTSPILMKPIPNLAAGEVTIWSIGRHIVTPMPTAAPLIAATIGLAARTKATQSSPAGMPPRPPAVSWPGSTPSMRDWNVVLHVGAGAEAAAGAGRDDRPDGRDRRWPA